MNRGLLIIVCVILLRVLPLHGQLTIFEQNRTHKQHVGYQTESTSSSITTNFLLTEIARSIPKNLEMTAFDIEFISTIQIKQVDSVNYILFAELKDFLLEGDVLYRNINISHILKPDLIDFVLVVERKNQPDIQVFKNSYSALELVDNMGYYSLVKTTFSDTVPNQQYTASVLNIKCCWSNQVQQKFVRMTALVHDYYQADKMIEKQMNLLKDINTEITEKVAFNNIVLRDIEKEYYLLMQRNFQTELNLWMNDPISFTQRMESFFKEMSKKRFEIDKKLALLDRLYHDKGLQKLREEKFDSARYYFNKATEYNPLFVPSLVEIAYLDFRKGVLDTAATKLILIFENTLPAPEDEIRLFEVCRLLISALDESVQRRILSQEYVEALNLLEPAIRLCAVAPDLECGDDMDKLLAQAKYGMYKSYLVVVEKAIETKRFEIARQYIYTAIAFQEENAVYIITPIEAEKYWSILYNACLKEVEQYNRNASFVKALEWIEWLDKLCIEVQSLDCSATVYQRTKTLKGLYDERIVKIEKDIETENFIAADTRLKLLKDFVLTHEEIDFDTRYFKAEKTIQTYHYHTVIGEALKNLEYDFMEPAFDKFLEAGILCEAFNLTPVEGIDSIFRITAVPVMIKRMSSLVQNQKRLEIVELKQQYTLYDSLVNKLFLTQNDTLTGLLKEIQILIDAKICSEVSASTDEMLQQIRIITNNHNFIAADSVYQIAILLCMGHPNCELPIQEMINSKKSLQDFIVWQKGNNSIEEMIIQQKWDEAVMQFCRVNEILNIEQKERYHIDSISLIQFISQKEIHELTIAGFEYFFEQKLWDNAFLMLEQLRKQGYPVQQSFDMQSRIGMKLAVRDKIANSEANFKINILKYTEGEEYFLYFSKAYKRTWRKY